MVVEVHGRPNVKIDTIGTFCISKSKKKLSVDTSANEPDIVLVATETTESMIVEI